MIVTTQKPLSEIAKFLESYYHILIVGCGTCATEVQTGGEKEVQEMADMLRGRWIVETMMIDAVCDVRLVRRAWRKIQKTKKEIDAVLVLACGAGIQTFSDIVELPCYPGLDTHFLGKVERIGLYYERCKACGVCLLGETAGICPITRCAKGLVNGPCGGMMNGKCEVGGYVRDCAWWLIWKRLKQQGRMELFRKIRPPIQHGMHAYPRGIDAIPSHLRITKHALFEPNETEELVVEAVRAAKKREKQSSINVATVS
jgi:hypothetical protein